MRPDRVHGPCDNIHYFNRWVQANPLYQGLFISNLNIHPFSGNWDEAIVPSMIYIANYGKALVLGQENPRPGEINVVSMAEAMGPALPGHLFLPGAQSGPFMIRAVQAVMYSENLDRISIATRDGYIQYIAYGGEPNALKDFVLEGDERVRRPTLYGLADDADWPEAPAANMTLAAAIRVLYYIAVTALRLYQRSGLNIICNVLVSVARRGMVSEGFINKVINGVRDGLGKTVSLNSDDIRTFYVTFGQGVNDTNIQEIVNRWIGFLPEAAMRITLTLQQISGSGITAFVIVGKAICKYRDFSWAEISLLFPDEWRNYAQAVEAVGGNVYYGFRRDLGPAKSTLFKSLAFIAKELLIRVGGYGSLRAYMGWTNRIPEQARVDMMIADYEEHRSRPKTEEEIDAHNDVIQDTLTLIYEGGPGIFSD